MIECNCIAEAHTYRPNCHVDVNKTNLKSLWPIRCVSLSVSLMLYFNSLLNPHVSVSQVLRRAVVILIAMLSLQYEHEP